MLEYGLFKVLNMANLIKLMHLYLKLKALVTVSRKEMNF